jgi:glycosyltransferase involved in cell wall biosynthesis
MDVVLRQPEWSRSGLEVLVLTPRGTVPSLSLENISVREVGRRGGHLWEQIDLPWHARGGLLLNLANTAPLAAGTTVATILDASVYAVPDAYSLPFRAWYRLLIPIIGRRAQRVVTCSEFSQVELERAAGIPRARTMVIHGSGEHILAQPADETVLERMGLRSGRYVLAVSSRSRHKNLAGVEQAASRLTGRDFSLVLAGGFNRRVFRGRPSPGRGNTSATGYVTDAELRALYQNAGCFVYPSFYEGFGLPPLEAMTCGCPVVVSNAASLPEVCGDAAVYCNPYQPADIAAAISRIMEDSSLRVELRRRGAERARQFSWNRSAESMLALVHGLARA